MNKTKTSYSPIGTVRLDLKRLEWFCKADIADFILLDGFVQYDTAIGTYFFKDVGAHVLAVAHLDTVQSIKNFELSRGMPEKESFSYTSFYKDNVWDKKKQKYVPVKKKKAKKKAKKVDKNAPLIVKSSRLDNRLGAYIVCDLLPQLGIYTDVLLTEGEESCSSTAQMFDGNEAKRQYNWMFSFDREGRDVVMYQYENKESEEQLEKHALDLGIGSYSDICELDWLECVGFNFGAGNYRSHQASAFAVVKQCYKQVRKFRSFYSEFRDTFMEYDVEDTVKFRDTLYRGGWSYLLDDWTSKVQKGVSTTALVGQEDRAVYGQGWALEKRETRIFDEWEEQLSSNVRCPWCGGFDVRTTLFDNVYKCAWCDCDIDLRDNEVEATLKYARLDRCNFCFATTTAGELCTVTDSDGYVKYVCRACRDAFYVKCDRCQSYVHHKMIAFVIDGDDTSEVCDACYDINILNNMNDVEHDSHITQEVEQCHYCGLSFYKEDKRLLKFGDSWLCGDCFDDMNLNSSIT